MVSSGAMRAVTVESKKGKGTTFNVFLPTHSQDIGEGTHGFNSLPHRSG
jgi:hypothetical protein